MKARTKQALLHYAMHFEQCVLELRLKLTMQLPNSTTSAATTYDAHHVMETIISTYRSDRRGRMVCSSFEPWHVLVAQHVWQDKPSKVDAIRQIRLATGMSLLDSKYSMDRVWYHCFPEGGAPTSECNTAIQKRCDELVGLLKESLSALKPVYMIPR